MSDLWAQAPAAVLRSLGRADEAKARCEKVLETAFDRFAAAWNSSASVQGRELVDARIE